MTFTYGTLNPTILHYITYGVCTWFDVHLAERSLDGAHVELARFRQRVAVCVDREREETTGSRLGTVPERDGLPHRSPHGPQTRPYQSHLVFVSIGLYYWSFDARTPLAPFAVVL